MANRLKKLASVQYTPGSPYQPGQPAYCYYQATTTPGHWTYRTVTETVVTSGGLTITRTHLIPKWHPPETTYRRICTPSIPERPAVPAVTSYTSIVGWTAGGRSADALSADGYFGFKINAGAIGVVVGLVTQDTNTQPNEPTHAFYVHETTVDILESGVLVATAPSAHAEAKQMRIIRDGTAVNYSYDGWTYNSAVPASGSQYLDVAIYFSGDAVFDPVIGVELSFGVTSSAGVQSALGLTHNGVGYLLGIKSNAGAQGEAYVNENGAEIDLLHIRSEAGATGSSDLIVDYALTATEEVGATGTARFVYTGAPDDAIPEGYGDGSAVGSLPSLDGLASEDRYAQAYGELPFLTGEAQGNFPTVEFSYAYGILPAIAGTSITYVGEYGEATGSLPTLAGMAAEDEHAQAYGTLPMLSGGAGLTTPGEDLPVLTQGLVIGDFMFGVAPVVDRISDALEIGDTAFGNIFLTDAVIDALVLQDSYSFTQVVQALIQSGLAISGSSTAAQRALMQYAVNVLTGALSTYSGFAFTGFAQAGNNVYGCKDDGVYVVRAGDDDGDPITIDIDFGATGYGQPTAKTIEAAYLGVATDGQVYLRANADGIERRYRVVQRGPIMRALLSRGVTGRRWNLAIEVVDATEFELDLVEIMVAVNNRRWTR